MDVNTGTGARAEASKRHSLTFSVLTRRSGFPLQPFWLTWLQRNPEVGYEQISGTALGAHHVPHARARW